MQALSLYETWTGSNVSLAHTTIEYRVLATRSSGRAIQLL